MWLDTSAEGDLIQMDTGTVKTVALQIVNQVIRGADVMGIHFNNLGSANASTCLCDIWDSSIPGFTEEVGALGEAVIAAFNNYLTATTDAVRRAAQLEADQAQVAASSGLGTVANVPGDGSFGALLAQAIVNDSNNANIATWVGGGTPTSQVDLLMAMNNPGGATNIDATLANITMEANENFAKVWLAPEGTSYAGQDDSGQDLYSSGGNTGTLGDIHRDTYDENYNGQDDDYTV